MEKKIFLLAVALTTLMPFSVLASENDDEAFLDTTYKTLQDVILPKAKWKRSDIASIPKFGGYVIGSYKFDNQSGQHGGDGFNLRLVRVYVDGSVLNDFKYRLQVCRRSFFGGNDILIIGFFHLFRNNYTNNPQSGKDDRKQFRQAALYVRLPAANIHLHEKSIAGLSL